MALDCADAARIRYRYDTESGRLYHTQSGHGRDMGRPIGNVSNGFRYSELMGKKIPTAHAVWLIHRGELPKGILRHLNGDNLDDRIENLAYVRNQLPVSYVHEGREVNEYGRIPKSITSGVYEIRCIRNGRRYIGSAVNITARWRLHYTQLQANKHHSMHLQRAWNKYGEAGFIFRVIESCKELTAVSREQHYIDTLNPEFNSRPNAGSQLGFKHSEDSRKKMSVARRRNPSSPRKGMRHTEEAKALISQNRRGKNLGSRPNDTVLKVAAAMREARSVLSPSLVLKGRELRSSGFTIQQVADHVGCSFHAAYDFIRGRTYNWVK